MTVERQCSHTVRSQATLQEECSFSDIGELCRIVPFDAGKILVYGGLKGLDRALDHK